MATTKLGIAPLTKDKTGSVELPEEITLFCPQCSTKVADKGQCLVELAMVEGESKTGFVVKLLVDCRSCGCHGREPAVDFSL